MEKLNSLEAYFFSKSLNSGNFRIPTALRNHLIHHLEQKIIQGGPDEIKTTIALIQDVTIYNAYSEINNLLFNPKSPSVFLCSLLFIDFKEHILGKKENYCSDFYSKLGNLNILDPYEKLTLKYDNASVYFPYASRVALVDALYKFESNKILLLKKCKNFSDAQKNELLELFKHLVPFFQITFDESIRQSGMSNSGADYESRIEDILKLLNLPYQKHVHEKNQESDQEHDFVFKYKNKSFGIGAKRTLRERYKQYNPQEVDLALVFTIGLDLGADKVERMTEGFKQKIFVADEVYINPACRYIFNNPSIYPSSQFTIETLDKFISELS